MIKFVCLFPLLFYQCYHGYPLKGGITDDIDTQNATDIIALIENLINQFNITSTDETQLSPDLDSEIQNATDIISRLEDLINQYNGSANHSETLDAIKIMFSKIKVGGGKIGGGSKGKIGGGSKGKIGGGSKGKIGGGGGSKTKIGGGGGGSHFIHRPIVTPRGGGGGGGSGDALTFLWVVLGFGGLAVLWFVLMGIFSKCST